MSVTRAKTKAPRSKVRPIAHASLLVELLTEELPPKSLARLSEAFTHHLCTALRDKGFLTNHSLPTPFATPRRLAVRISAVRERQEDRVVERRGPAVASALDANGQPTPALLGFARSCGVEPAKLERRAAEKGEYFVFCSKQTGQPLGAQLSEMVEAAARALPVPKLMRWGAGDIEFVRPVHGVVMLHGRKLIAGTVLGLKSRRTTLGHRFMSRGAITLTGADTYEKQLERQGAVIANREARIKRIEKGLDTVAKRVHKKARWNTSSSAALIDEVTNLVEYPVVLAGTFDTAFLTVPKECLTTSMQQHQRYFPLQDAGGKLLPAFLFVANIKARSAKPIIDGNERVLKARLDDARFFFEQDKKTPLAARVPRLSHVVYHNKLGSQLDRVRRLQGLAAVIAERLKLPVSLAKQAAELCKADLLTDMVGEFPELQGVMGFYYAKAEGLPDEVAIALREHYRPRFADDGLPANPLGSCVALADKLEALVGIFGIGLAPTGDKDPFALRRQALGVIRILVEQTLPLDALELVHAARAQFSPALVPEKAAHEVYAFMLERLKSYLRERSFLPDEIDAVVSLNPTRLDHVVPRLSALQAFRELPAAEALAAANKRIHNILKQAGDEEVPPEGDASLLTEPAERALANAVEKADARVAPLVANADYAPALVALAGLREPVDRFFDDVMVMVDDVKLRQARLALLNRIRQLFLHVADVSRLQV